MKRYEYTTKEEMELRLTEIETILINQTDSYFEIGEEELLKEKSYLEIELDILNQEV